MAAWRPKYHYTPDANWLSDPNGLLWHGGLWHLYYQYNPYGDEWGHMSWGHAVSDDLIGWRELPVAIPENDQHMIFSGSAVAGPDGQMIAAYTGATRAPPGSQAQFLVHSNDGGMTFAAAGKAAIDEGSSDFRDPKLFWHMASKKWIMLAVRADSSCAVIYASDDLGSWRLLSQIGPFDVPGQVWECPELLELPVDGGGSRWLFKVDLLHVDPAHTGSGAIALSGIFDGHNFTPDCDAHQKPYWQWVDHGRDFYAAIAWNDGPKDDNNRYWIGWMGNHRYQKLLPQTGWRGAMSVARSLGFRKHAGRWLLVQRPVVPAHSTSALVTQDALELSPGQTVPLGQGLPRALYIRTVAGSGNFTLNIDAGPSRLIIDFDVAGKNITLDRSGCGIGEHRDDFCRPMIADWLDAGQAVELWLDDHSIEIFADGGATVLTVQTFHVPGALDVSVFSDAGSGCACGIAISEIGTDIREHRNAVATMKVG